MPALVLAQPRIAASLDTIAMTIGEDIQYQIEVQTDSTAQVIFPTRANLLAFRNYRYHKSRISNNWQTRHFGNAHTPLFNLIREAITFPVSGFLLMEHQSSQTP